MPRPRTPERLRDARAGLAAAAVGAALMLGLGLWGLGRPSMFGSEADTFWAAQLPAGDLAHLLSHVDAVHGCYYSLVHPWLAEHATPETMRVPSLLGATGAAWLTARLGTRLAGTTVGLGAGVLFALTPFVDQYAQDGRSYALVCCAVAATALALVAALERPDRRRRWIGYAALLTVTGYLHEFALLAAAAFAVTVVLARPPRAVVLRWLAATAGGCLPVVPLIAYSAHESGAIGYLPAPRLATLAALGHVDFGAVTATSVLLAGCAVVAIVPVRVAWVAGVTAARLAVPLVVVPSGMLLLESEVGRHVYDVRYVLFGTVGAALLAAAGADRIGRALTPRAGPAARRWGRLLVLVAVCAAVLVAQWPVQQQLRTVASRRQDLGGVSRYLAAHARTGDAVLFMPRSLRSAALGYPQDYRHLDDVALAVPPRRAGTFLGVDRAPAALRVRMIAHARIWVVGRYPLSAASHGPVGAVTVLRHSFLAVAHRRFAGAAVTLYQRVLASP